jgi:hypothetical protein
MASIQNVERLYAKLRALADKARKKPRAVVVGYSQAYAIYVHENLEAHHEVGQAKFLEEPLRNLAPVLRQEINDGMRQGMDLEDCLLKAGFHLQRESQQLVPVDTGALRASAFTGFAEDLDALASEAQSRGEAKRQTAHDKVQKQRLEKQLRKV